MKPFESIVEDHGATVFRVCRAVVGPIDADDAWSETFLAALTAYPRLSPDSNIRAWLVTIAHRKAIDLVRIRSREALPIAEIPDQHSPRAVPDDEGREVWRAVAALPERQRLAVAYHYFGGLPHADTAELVGGSVESIRRAAADGIASLRRTYNIQSERSAHDSVI